MTFCTGIFCLFCFCLHWSYSLFALGIVPLTVSSGELLYSFYTGHIFLSLYKLPPIMPVIFSVCYGTIRRTFPREGVRGFCSFYTGHKITSSKRVIVWRTVFWRGTGGTSFAFTTAMLCFCFSNGSIVVNFDIDVETDHNLKKEDFLQSLRKSGRAEGPYIDFGAIRMFSSSVKVLSIHTVKQQEEVLDEKGKTSLFMYRSL